MLPYVPCRMVFEFKIIFRAKSKKPQALSVVQVQVTNIQPKENVVYTKQTQTTNSGTQHERDGEALSRLFVNVSCLLFNQLKRPTIKFSLSQHLS